ncbi:MAG: hypothetical protein ACP5IO_02155 [Elusimicrobiales bacterium]
MKKILIILLPLAAFISVVFICTDNFRQTTFISNLISKNIDDKAKKNQIEGFNSQIKFESSKPTFSYQKAVSFELEIKGSQDFKAKVKNAIRLLWLYDREGSFTLLKRYVFEIAESNRTCFSVRDDKTPVIEISSQKANQSSITFLASIIAHNLWHAYYQIETKKKKKKERSVPLPGEETTVRDFEIPLPSPKKFDDVFSIERSAFEYQYTILEKIGASNLEKKLLKKRKYNDFSLSHDGNYIIYF